MVLLSLWLLIMERHNRQSLVLPVLRLVCMFAVCDARDNLYLLYSSSTSIDAFNIRLLVATDFDDCRNILVSFGRQCPPMPSLGSSISTFHLVFRASRNSGKFMLLD